MHFSTHYNVTYKWWAIKWMANQILCNFAYKQYFILIDFWFETQEVYFVFINMLQLYYYVKECKIILFNFNRWFQESYSNCRNILRATSEWGSNKWASEENDFVNFLLHSSNIVFPSKRKITCLPNRIVLNFLFQKFISEEEELFI